MDFILSSKRESQIFKLLVFLLDLISVWNAGAYSFVSVGLQDGICDSKEAASSWGCRWEKV